MNYRLELGHLIAKNGGGTFKNLTDVLYYTRLFKYVYKKQYRMINNLFYKVTADWKLLELCERGYLFSPQKDVYCATTKVDPLLKEAGYLTVFPDQPKGIGDINQFNNTEVFIKLLKEPHFYTLLFPNFGYLVPDALLVEKKVEVIEDEEIKKYKLTFIEVEAPKPDWTNYLRGKEKNYLQLAKDYQFYEVWSNYCEQLNLPKPTLDIKFNYKIYKL